MRYHYCSGNNGKKQRKFDNALSFFIFIKKDYHCIMIPPETAAISLKWQSKLVQLSGKEVSLTLLAMPPTAIIAIIENYQQKNIRKLLKL